MKYNKIAIISILLAVGASSAIAGVWTANNSRETQTTALTIQSQPSQNSELAKLDKRQQRWEAAKKCVRSTIVENGKTEELCQNNLDIKQLVDEAGTISAFSVINEHLKAIEFDRKQLADGIIDKISTDAPMTEQALLYAVERHRAQVENGHNDTTNLDRSKAAIERFEKNYQPDL